jgi:hypothetical protein
MDTRNPAAYLLIIIGVLLLAANFGLFSLLRFWPLLVIAAGLVFFALWTVDRGNHGLLMPASVLVVIGVLCLYCELYGWWNMQDLWPVFILAPGVGFLLMYLLGHPDRGVLVPGAILMVIGIVFLSANRWAGRWWPVVLIAAGVLVLLRPRRDDRAQEPPAAELNPEPAISEPEGASRPADDERGQTATDEERADYD